MPGGPSEFDLVTWLDVSYHMVDDQVWSAALREIARVLRPGGKLVIMDRFGEVGSRPSAHVNFRSTDVWLDAASACGLDIEKVEATYRFLSRERDRGRLRRLDDRLRGPIEFGLDSLALGRPHMRCACS